MMSLQVLPTGAGSVTLADGTTHTKTVQITASGSAAGLVTDGSVGTATARALLGGEVDLYVDNSNGDLTSDELARIQDAITAVDAVTVPYGVAVEETTDPSQAEVTLDMAAISPVSCGQTRMKLCITGSGAPSTMPGV